MLLTLIRQTLYCPVMIIHLPHTRDLERLHDDERRCRMLGFSISLVCIGAILVLLLILTGCGTTANPALGPAALQASVTLGTEIATDRHPELVPQFRLAGTAACAVADGTNIAPAEMVSAMDKAGITNLLARDIMNGFLATYNVAYVYVGTNFDRFRPYSRALCDGIRMGLPPEGPPQPMAKRKELPPHLK
jgi:hypothetical protein